VVAVAVAVLEKVEVVLDPVERVDPVCRLAVAVAAPVYRQLGISEETCIGY